MFDKQIFLFLSAQKQIFNLNFINLGKLKYLLKIKKTIFVDYY